MGKVVGVKHKDIAWLGGDRVWKNRTNYAEISGEQLWKTHELISNVIEIDNFEEISLLQQ